MLRYLIFALLILGLSTPFAHSADGVPSEIEKLKGKRVRIYHNVNLLGGETPLAVHVDYLKMLMQRAGAIVETVNHTAEKADLVIFGELLSPETDPFAASFSDRQTKVIEKYKESRPRLEREAAAAGSRVIHFPDVARKLGIQTTQAQIVKQLDERAHSDMRKNLPPLEANALPFVRIIDLFRDAIEADIDVDWRALEAIGVMAQQPVTIELDALTVGEALAKMLDKTAGRHGLTYVIRDGTIRITTEERLKDEAR